MSRELNTTGQQDDSFALPKETIYGEKEMSPSVTSISRAGIDRLKEKIKTAAELAEDPAPETKWLIESVLPEGAFVMLQGPPKSAGKTTFLTHALAAITTGDEFLGLPCRKSKVLYLTEQSRNFETEYLGPVGLSTSEDFSLLYAYDASLLPWKQVAKAAVESCRENEIDLLVIDTVAHFTRMEGDSENFPGPVLNAMRPLQDAVAASERLTIVIVHHDRKSGGDLATSGRGSGAYAGSVDAILGLRGLGNQSATTTNVRKLKASGRYANMVRELTIELTQNGYVNHGSQSSVTDTKARLAILELLPTDEDQAMSKRDIAEKLEEELENEEFSKRAIRRVLEALTKEHVVDSKKIGGRGDPDGFWLVSL